MTLTRSSFLHLAGAALLARPALAQTGARMHIRKIPATGEPLPVIGCGTWQTFDVGAAPAERAPRAEVLKVLFEAGGSAIDSSPMYGRAEEVVGDLLAAAGTRDKAFLATKVWTHGKAEGLLQMEQSFKRLRTDRIDLMQIHNLVDWKTHLPTLKAWKAEGRIRLIGITHYTESMHDELEAVLQLGGFDFVQVNYALDDRGIERRLLRFCQTNGIAMLINQPFGGGGLLRKLSGRELPDWATEIGCTSWAQILLKFVLAQPAVTCVIPGTGKPEHMRDNVQAGLGAYPDRKLLDRMSSDIAT
ncbi:MAG: aldo/keto reductase [Reyranella sp.]|uniref:aldo/keto reductase n=1 Tax=Reyranella sp. TaxID=1929291 RepID=UPI001AC6C680|nr:aldo/keto reductase [Reyranella sp.]MBN9091542.1 aldo/keto reductase [Reyranella sp.]